MTSIRKSLYLNGLYQRGKTFARRNQPVNCQLTTQLKQLGLPSTFRSEEKGNLSNIADIGKDLNDINKILTPLDDAKTGPGINDAK